MSRRNEYGATVDRHKSLTNRVNVESVNMKYLSAEYRRDPVFGGGCESIFVRRLYKGTLCSRPEFIGAIPQSFDDTGTQGTLMDGV